MFQNPSNLSVADYISEFLVQLNCTKVHGLMGGGAAGLNDGFIRNPDIDYLCYHHEQSAGYAAIGEARLTKKWAIINPTTGCGGTNCYTPVLNAWQDSLPLVVISGNVNLSTCSRFINSDSDLSLRCYGVQEHDIVESVGPVTKYAELLTKAEDIPLLLQTAFVRAASGRKGPCWIDVPADIQHQQIPKSFFENIPDLVDSVLKRVDAIADDNTAASELSKFAHLFKKSERPLVLVGGGVSNDLKEKETVAKFIRAKNLPVVATYGATDIVDHDYALYLGAVGIKGNRAANFAVQNCDFLLVLGSRLPFSVIGYDIKNFAKHAHVCVADMDESELKKNLVNFPSRIVQAECSAGLCVSKLKMVPQRSNDRWIEVCSDTKIRWNNIEENKEYYSYTGISIYHVLEELNQEFYNNSNFVVDAGSISYAAPTSLKYKNDRNFIFSPGQADMGCALPTSLGVAANSSNRTICITGDGSFMSNLQELAVLAHHDYNLTVVVLNNNGYMSITNTQKNNYGENQVYGEHQGRGITFPKYEKLCEAFGLSYQRINRVSDLSDLQDCDIRVVEVVCIDEETISPYQARVDGRQAGAHDMAPFRSTDELSKFASVILDFERQ